MTYTSPLAESLAPDLLASAPAHWQAKQYVGVWIQFLSYLLSAVAIVGEMYRSYLPSLSPAAMMTLRVAPLVGIAVAVWLLTTPRPNRRVSNATRLVRYGFAAVCTLLNVLTGNLEPDAGTIEYSANDTPRTYRLAATSADSWAGSASAAACASVA